MAYFMKAPVLPDPTYLRLDHITALLALLLEGPNRSAAIDLLYQSYAPEEANYTRSTWEPHILPPPTHPLYSGTPARDFVPAMLYMDYTTPENTAGDA